MPSDTKAATREFGLILEADDVTDEMADRLFEAGCDDASLGMRAGVVFLAFHREAPTFREALFSAIRDVRKAGLKVREIDGGEVAGLPVAADDAPLAAHVNSVLEFYRRREADPELQREIIEAVVA